MSGTALTHTPAHAHFQDRPVTWRGQTAVYSLSEEREMRGLPEREALILHTLKALFGGEIMNPADDALRLDQAVERLDSSPETTKGPVPRKRNEPSVGQTTIAV